MHIALISPAWPLGFPNGVVTYVHHLRAGLQALGHRVSVLAFLGAEGSSDDGTYPLLLDWRTRLGHAIARVSRRPVDASARTAQIVIDSVMRLHQRDPIDVVEMEESYGWFDSIQQRLSMPVVVKLHGPAFLSLVEEELAMFGSDIKMAAERHALQRARFVTAPSRDTLDRTRDDCGQPPDWGRVIPNPIVVAADTPLWSRKRADPDTLLFVGRFDKRKGGDIAIRAFGRLLEQRPKLKLVFVGPDIGILSPSGQRVRLEEFIRAELPAWHRTRIEVTGSLGPAEIGRLRCQAAITLVCSRWESFGYVVAESMMQGCPVAAIDAGAVSEVITHGVSGLLAPRGDTDAFCRQILWLLDHPEAGEAFGAAAHRRAREVYDMRAVAADTAAYYAHIVGEHQRSAGSH